MATHLLRACAADDLTVCMEQLKLRTESEQALGLARGLVEEVRLLQMEKLDLRNAIKTEKFRAKRAEMDKRIASIDGRLRECAAGLPNIALEDFPQGVVAVNESIPESLPNRDLPPVDPALYEKTVKFLMNWLMVDFGLCCEAEDLNGLDLTLYFAKTARSRLPVTPVCKFSHIKGSSSFDLVFLYDGSINPNSYKVLDSILSRMELCLGIVRGGQRRRKVDKIPFEHYRGIEVLSNTNNVVITAYDNKDYFGFIHSLKLPRLATAVYGVSSSHVSSIFVSLSLDECARCVSKLSSWVHDDDDLTKLTRWIHLNADSHMLASLADDVLEHVSFLSQSYEPGPLDWKLSDKLSLVWPDAFPVVLFPHLDRWHRTLCAFENGTQGERGSDDNEFRS